MSPYERSYALVVGVSDYAGGWPPLSEAAGDAERVAEALRRQGFAVSLLTNEEATKDSILRELQVELPKRLKPKDRFIMYFAGHGQTISTASGIKQGFLVPHDGRISGKRDEPQTYIPMSQLKEVMSMYLNSTHNLLVLDSCFSGLMLSRGVKLKAPAAAALKPGSAVLTAGGHNQKSSDGVFTPVFLEAIEGAADQNRDGELSFAELSGYVKGKMKHLAPKQTPQFGQLSGEGALALYPRAAPSTPPPQIRRPGAGGAPLSEPPSALPRRAPSGPSPAARLALGSCKVHHSTRLAAVFESLLGGQFCGALPGRFEQRGARFEDAALGVQWSRVSAKRLTLEEAKEVCQQMGEGFRLPSLQELVSLVQETPTDEGYISAVFFDQNREWLWSAEFNSDEDVAASVDFSQGDLHAEYKRNLRNFRCLRPSGG